MVTEFGRHTKSLILRRFRSLRAFVAQAEPHRSADIGIAYLSKVIHGQTPPLIDRVQAWADALGLVEDERQRFLDLAALEYVPEWASARFRGLLSDRAWRSPQRSVAGPTEAYRADDAPAAAARERALRGQEAAADADLREPPVKTRRRAPRPA